MIGINLIAPEELHARLNRRHMRRWAVISMATGILGTGPVLWATIENARLASLKDQQQSMASQMAQVRRDLLTMKQHAGAIASEMEQASAFRRKRNWSGVMSLIAQCLPPDAWLESVATDPQAPPLAAGGGAGGRRIGTALAPTTMPSLQLQKTNDPAAGSRQTGPRIIEIDAPRRLLIRGQASTFEASQLFASRLSDTRAFSTVTIVRSIKNPSVGSEVYSFDVECEW